MDSMEFHGFHGMLSTVQSTVQYCIYIYGALWGPRVPIYGALWGPRVPGLMDPGLRDPGPRVPGLRDPGPRVPGLRDPGPGAQGGLRDPGPGTQGGPSPGQSPALYVTQRRGPALNEGAHNEVAREEAACAPKPMHLGIK